MVPYPIAVLLKAGAWSDILLLLRWHARLQGRHTRQSLGPISTWPPMGSRVWKLVGMHRMDFSTESREKMTDESLAAMSTALRLVAPEATEVGQSRLLEVVVMLDRWSEGLAHKSAMIVHGKFRIDAMRLFECIRLCQFLKGGSSKLEHVVAHSLSLSLPEELRSAFLQSSELGGPQVMPYIAYRVTACQFVEYRATALFRLSPAAYRVLAHASTVSPRSAN